MIDPLSPKHKASVGVAVTVGVGLMVIGNVMDCVHPPFVNVKVIL